MRISRRGAWIGEGFGWISSRRLVGIRMCGLLNFWEIAPRFRSRSRFRGSLSEMSLTPSHTLEPHCHRRPSPSSIRIVRRKGTRHMTHLKTDFDGITTPSSAREDVQPTRAMGVSRQGFGSNPIVLVFRSVYDIVFPC